MVHLVHALFLAVFVVSMKNLDDVMYGEQDEYMEKREKLTSAIQNGEAKTVAKILKANPDIFAKKPDQTPSYHHERGNARCLAIAIKHLDVDSIELMVRSTLP